MYTPDSTTLQHGRTIYLCSRCRIREVHAYLNEIKSHDSSTYRMTAVLGHLLH